MCGNRRRSAAIWQVEVTTMSKARCFVVAGFLVGLTITAPSIAADRPNVIVIMTDDQGTAALGAAGAMDIETPHLDAISRSGVRFSQFYAAAPVCSPSRASMLTGRYPFRAGMPTNAPAEAGSAGMPSREVTIAEMLKPAGY